MHLEPVLPEVAEERPADVKRLTHRQVIERALAIFRELDGEERESPTVRREQLEKES